MPQITMAIRSNVVSVGSILTKLQTECATPLPVLRHVADAMSADMRAGLAADGGSDLKMILSYVDSLPNGYFKLYFCSLCQPFFWPGIVSVWSVELYCVVLDLFVEVY